MTECVNLEDFLIGNHFPTNAQKAEYFNKYHKQKSLKGTESKTTKAISKTNPEDDPQTNPL